ncbi:hypothetical protein BCR37DRAFT_409536 [Protomyces lactucae-debilis]|uniref:Short-chain dehydrogenase n=1 Tax=Protomyces lactucae-debilis TaxID=2754530 RepID=A0A1Y2FLN6_PROLT|nr:uncharacterized protein BCR37DRAFT_409536 [Protomyces lactucae-debilis]ORY84880.1 hypothetical protein BCR37DRAFT_409536 [Protomyces lactucae-debilis]
MAEKQAILITGASKGLGYATVKQLLDQGHHVVTISRSTSSLDTLKRKVEGRLQVIQGDVSDADVYKQAIGVASLAWDLALTGIIFNAGVLDPVTKLDQADAADWAQCFQTNLFSIVSALPVMLPHLRSGNAAEKPKILLISSGAATGSYQGWSAYGCAKAALNHLAQDLGVEEPDITTLAVRPGVVATDMQRAIREQHQSAMNPDQHKKFTKLHSDGELLDADTVAAVLSELVLRADHRLSGQFIDWADYKEL